MTKVAIDITLVIPPEIEAICFELNKQSNKSKYVSFGDGNKPHISLAMGAVNKEDLNKIEDELKNKIGNIYKLDLSILELKVHKFRDYFIYDFSVSLTDKICMEVVEKYSSGETTIEMFNENEKVDELTVSWTNTYKETSAGENYKPHITLGAGIPENVPQLPIDFKVKEIAIFQLGPFCTCKNKLEEFILK